MRISSPYSRRVESRADERSGHDNDARYDAHANRHREWDRNEARPLQDKVDIKKSTLSASGVPVGVDP